MSDPAAMQRAMEIEVREPAAGADDGAAHAGRRRHARSTNDGAHDAGPGGPGQMRQLQASLGAGMGLPPPMGAAAAPGPTRRAAAAPRGLNNGSGGGAAAPQANNVNENGDAMSEEEGQAIRRSMRGRTTPNSPLPIRFSFPASAREIGDVVPRLRGFACHADEPV